MKLKSIRAAVLRGVADQPRTAGNASIRRTCNFFELCRCRRSKPVRQYQLTDQARHRHHRRESQLRSRVRHLCATRRRAGLEPALRGHRQQPTAAPDRTSTRPSSRRPVTARPTPSCSTRPRARLPNGVLPAPLVGGPKDSYVTGDSLTLAQQSENGLPSDYYPYLVHGGTGQTSKTPDMRITNVDALPPGPFQLTNGKAFTYDSYAASPVHRFYQMWQQLDCSLEHATREQPSGCDARLFSWVEVTVGAGTNGRPAGQLQHRVRGRRAPPPAKAPRRWASTTCSRATRPTSSSLRRHYAMSDNFHQSVNGGTGANHIMLGHGDAIWFSDGTGNAADAAAQRRGRHGHRRMPASSTRSRIPNRCRQAPTTGTPKTATAAAPFGARLLRRRLLQRLRRSDPAGRAARS